MKTYGRVGEVEKKGTDPFSCVNGDLRRIHKAYAYYFSGVSG